MDPSCVSTPSLPPSLPPPLPPTHQAIQRKAASMSRSGGPGHHHAQHKAQLWYEREHQALQERMNRETQVMQKSPL